MEIKPHLFYQVVKILGHPRPLIIGVLTEVMPWKSKMSRMVGFFSSYEQAFLTSDDYNQVNVVK